MTRRVLSLLLLAAALPAAEEDGQAARVRALIGQGDASAALREAERVLAAAPESGLLRLVHAEAVRACARDLQRREGHAAAMVYLEDHLTHPLLAAAYGETCAWAGEEERGIERLRGCAVRLPLRIRAELDLLSLLGRWDEVARRAERARWPEWVEWAREQGGLRGRLAGRRRRGALAAAAAAGTILLAVGVLFRLAGRPAPSGSRS